MRFPLACVGVKSSTLHTGMLAANADEPGAPPEAGYAGGDDEAAYAQQPPPKRKLLQQGSIAGYEVGVGPGLGQGRGPGRASSPRVAAAWL